MKNKKFLQFISACFLAFMSLFSVSTLQGQAMHYSFGIPGTNQIADIVRTLPDGSSIIAGYTYTGASITNADMLLMKVKDGHIIWEKRWGNPGNDFIQDMVIGTVGDPNGSIILVAAEHNATYSPYAVASIYRFTDATGSLMWENNFYGYSGTGYDFTGDVVLKSVCELTPGGNIVVAGYLNFHGTGLANRALVATFDNHLSYIWHDVMNNVPVGTTGSHSHIFTGVVADASHPVTAAAPGRVLLCGGDFDGSVNKATLVSYTPPTTHMSGVLNSYRLYNLIDGTKKHSMFTQIFYAYKDPSGVHTNDRLMLNGMLSDDHAFSTDSKQFTFSSDPTGVLALNIHTLKNSSTFTNTSRIYPYLYTASSGDFALYTCENPNATLNDPVLAGSVPVLEGVETNISSLNGGTIAFCRSSFSSAGTNISILDTRREYGLGYTIGSIDKHNGTTNKYIYFSVFNPVYNKTTIAPPPTIQCTYHDSILAINALQTTSTVLSFGFAKFFCHSIPNLTAVVVKDSVDSCGTRPVNNPCATVGTATLSVTGTAGPSGCSYTATMNVSPGPGWTVDMYNMVGPCFPGMSFPSSFNTFSHGFSLATGACCTITIWADLVDAYGNHCTISKSQYVCCKPSIISVSSVDCGTTTLSPTITNYPGGSIGYSYTAAVNVDPSIWTVVEYDWTGPAGNYTDVTQNMQDVYQYFILQAGTSASVSATVLLVDGFGNTCTLIENDGQVVPGCGTVLINSVPTQTSWGCSVATSATVTPDPGWYVVDYTWNGPAGQYNDVNSQNTDPYQNFTLQPGASASVSVTAHLSDGLGDDCYISNTVPSVGCPSYCSNSTVQVTPTVTPDPSGCIVSTAAVVSLDPYWTIVDYNWDGPAGAYTDVTSSPQDAYQNFVLQPGTSAQVTLSVDLTDIYGYGDICTISQAVTPMCADSKHNNNAGLSNLQPSKSGIIIYPNPTDGLLNISSSESNIMSVEVYDIAGKRLGVYNFDNTKAAQISIAEYAVGTYVVKVNNNVKQIVNKIK